MVSFTGGVSLSYRPCYENRLNYDNENKCQTYDDIKVNLWQQV